MGDREWLDARADAARAEEERLLAAAKAAAAQSGKEPFDYEKLCTMYDPSSDMGYGVHDPAERARQLAGRRAELDTWR